MASLHLLTRAVLAVVAAILGWTALNASSALVAAAPEAATSAYAYDSHHFPVVAASATTERGPPAAPEIHTNYDAVGRWSHGTSTRPGTAAPRAARAYEDGTPLMEVARTTGTTHEPVRRFGGDRSPVATGRVAAKSVTGAYDEALAGGRHAGFLRNYANKPTPPRSNAASPRSRRRSQSTKRKSRTRRPT